MYTAECIQTIGIVLAFTAVLLGGKAMIKRAIYWLGTMYRVIRRKLGYPVTIARSDDGTHGIEEAE